VQFPRARSPAPTLRISTEDAGGSGLAPQARAVVEGVAPDRERTPNGPPAIRKEPLGGYEAETAVGGHPGVEAREGAPLTLAHAATKRFRNGVAI